MPIRHHTFALRTTALYIILAAAWVTLGDLLVYWAADGANASARMQLAKGWMFVLLSGVFVYWLARLTRHRWFAAHTELVAARQEFEAAERVAGVGHWIRAPGSDWVHWSAEMFRIMDMDPGAGRVTLPEILERIHPEDRDSVAQDLAALQDCRAGLNNTHRIIRPSGEIRWVNVRGEMVRGGDGECMLTGTLHDITEMKEVENELRGAHARLDALTAHLEYAREEERRRLAMDIHDDVGAGLSGLRMSLTLLKRDVAHLPDSGARIDSIDRDLDGIIATVRHLGADLRPPALDALGLVPALEVLAAEWSRRCNCAVELDIDDEAAVDMPPDRSIQVYRIVQEALTNVARHASASFVVITLRVTRDRLVISISDDGRGMGDRARGHHSFGLANMHQRARLLGGVVDF